MMFYLTSHIIQLYQSGDTIEQTSCSVKLKLIIYLNFIVKQM